MFCRDYRTNDFSKFNAFDAVDWAHSHLSHSTALTPKICFAARIFAKLDLDKSDVSNANQQCARQARRPATHSARAPGTCRWYTISWHIFSSFFLGFFTA
jgi:hypothetical protein